MTPWEEWECSSWKQATAPVTGAAWYWQFQDAAQTYKGISVSEGAILAFPWGAGNGELQWVVVGTVITVDDFCPVY